MSYWTEERVETLKKLWQKGHTASDISNIMQGPSRNAVLGKVHRLKLPKRVGALAPKVGRPRKSTKAARTNRARRNRSLKVHVKAKPTAKTLNDIVARTKIELKPKRFPGTGYATIDSLGDNMCRWPCEIPGDDTHYFCGHYSTKNNSYCDFHHARSRSEPRRRRRSTANHMHDGLIHKIALG